MTAFDDELLRVIAAIARGHEGEATVTAADLAETMDSSDKSIRRAWDRLTAAGRLEVIHNPGGGPTLRIPGGVQGVQTGQPDPTPPTGVCGVGLDSPVQTGHAQNNPSGRRPQHEKPTGPQPRRPDPNCERCEGTGWQTVDRIRDVVAVCDCRGPETVAYQRRRQADLERTWTSPKTPQGGIPTPSERVNAWRAHMRAQIAGVAGPPPDSVVLHVLRGELEDSVARHPSNGAGELGPPVPGQEGQELDQGDDADQNQQGDHLGVRPHGTTSEQTYTQDGPSSHA